LLLDTYAWVEFFRGTKKGERVKEILKSQCFTCAISLAELNEWCHREKLRPHKYSKIVKELSIIIVPDEAIYELAGRINFLQKKRVKGWGIVDSLILTTAKIYGLTIVTGDRHFKNIKNVIMI